MKFFATPNSKNIIVTLRIVAIEKSGLTFLLMLYFHGNPFFLNKNYLTVTMSILVGKVGLSLNPKSLKSPFNIY